MQFYVLHNNQRVGPYTADEIRERINQGGFSQQALGWREGLPEWLPLVDLIRLPGARPPRAPQAAAAPKTGAASSAPARAAGPVPLDGPRIVALAGAALLCLGTLLPVVALPIIGGMNFLKTGWPAYVVLLAAAATVAVVFTRRTDFFWLTGGVSALTLAGTLVNFLVDMHHAKTVAVAYAESAGNPFANLGQELGKAALDSVQLQWGCFVLGLGAALICGAARQVTLRRARA